MHRKLVPVLACLACLSAFVVWVAPASAETAWWRISSGLRPARLEANVPGHDEGQLIVSAINLGDLALRGEPGTPVVITDTLPEGLRATSGARNVENGGPPGGISCPGPFPTKTVVCEWRGEGAFLEPYELLELSIHVTDVGGGGGEGGVTVSGGEGVRCTKIGSGHNFDGPYCTGGSPPEGEETPGGGEYEREPTHEAVPSASFRQPAVTEGATTPFGVQSFAMFAEEEGGALSTQAGVHPFEFTTRLELNQASVPDSPPALPRDLSFQLPPGLVGNPTVFPQCPESKFSATFVGEAINECPADTVVGMASVSVWPGSRKGNEVLDKVVPVFNLPPSPGEPARFGFEVETVPVVLDTSVRTGGDYGITVTAHNITQAANFLSEWVSFWGAPGDARHSLERGWLCLEGGRYGRLLGHCEDSAVGVSQQPFLTLPTSCSGPMPIGVEGDSWSNGSNIPSVLLGGSRGAEQGSEALIRALSGCNRLPFNVDFEASPDVQQASSSSGMSVKIKIPQEADLDPTGLASADVRTTTVALPAGMALNPSGGDGLTGCGESGIGFLPGEQGPFGELHFTPTLVSGHESEPLEPGPNLQADGFCPDASKIATARIKSPLLPHELKGFVYLASQNANPFGSLVAMYLVVEDHVSGTLVKAPGRVGLCGAPGEDLLGYRCEAAGQVVTVFEDSPPLPFEELELHFFGGERAPLATPALCKGHPAEEGRPAEEGYVTRAAFTPWSSQTPIYPTSEFDIREGPNHSACPNPPGDQSLSTLPFNPSLNGGATNVNAGAFSPLTGTFGREDGEQQIAQVRFTLPPGLSGLLSSVKLCPEEQANDGTCGPESLIGETTVSAGVGSDPISVKGGKVYITEKYHGAPFGLSVVNPVKAGPFDLEHDTSNPSQDPSCDCVVVRAKIEIDPYTSALTITTNGAGEGYSIPSTIDNIPVEIRRVNFITNRPDFQFNPTSCNQMKITGQAISSEGVTRNVEVPFQVANCKNLKFEPKFTVSTQGKTSKTDGASLSTKVEEPANPIGTQANIAQVKVELPKQLPSRLTTLQKACTAAQFEANPAACPAASKIGYAVVHTPLIPVPLEGPAIFVSHGGEAFPSLTMVLQGYGITIDLVGTTFISKAGITSTTFKAVPDQPFNTFELTLPEGPYSALAANGSLCAPTTTETVKKKVTIKVHGHARKVTRKTTEQVATTLSMPTEFVAQNGETIHQNTPVTVSECAGVKGAKTSRHNKSKKRHGKRK